MYGAGDARIETVPDARLVEPTDALVVVTYACICGSDLWPYKQLAPSANGVRMGHEFVASFRMSVPTSARSSAATSSSHRSLGPTVPASSARKDCRPRVFTAGGGVGLISMAARHALRRHGNGPSRGRRGQGRPGQERGRRRRWRGEPLRRDRRPPARRRADHPTRPPSRPDRAGPMRCMPPPALSCSWGLVISDDHN